jgi:hypothetical protein
MKRPVLALLLLSLSVRPAGARECPLPDGAASSLATIDAEARLAFLQRGMRKAARQSRIWAWSSVAALSAVGNFQVLGATHVPDPGDRIDLWVGAASLLFSIAQIAVVPPLVTIDQWKIDRMVARARPDADRCALLAEAERLLVRDARGETIATGPAMHVATLLFNIGTGLVLGIAFNRWESGALNIFLGAALGELQIVTEPTDSVTLLERYRAGDLAPRKDEKARLQWRLLPSVARGQAGLSWGVSF